MIKGLHKISGIYKIQSKCKSERIYIGSAIYIYQRWQSHLNTLKRNKHENKKLQNHYNKYGKNDLIFSIVIGCDKADLISTEQFYIDALNPYFNICKIAGNCLGIKRTEETKHKLSIKTTLYRTGKKLSEETKKKISIANKGNKNGLGYRHSEEIKKRISEAKKGMIFSDNHIKKLRESHLGHIPWNKGKTGIYSDEIKKRMVENRFKN